MGGDFTEFFAELEVMKSLRHPNIVRLFGMGRVWSEDVGEEQLLIVTELCFGDLTSIIRPEVTVEEEYTPARLGEVCAQLLTGVAYMHRAGYAHKDLKPSNVLLAADGTVKLCDLGMASAARDRCLTLDVGTFAYMPPEAFSSSSAPVDDDESGQQPTIIPSHGSSGFGDFGNNDADDSVDATKWDVYSLAVMLVELWAGRHPWEDLTRIRSLTSSARASGQTSLLLPPSRTAWKRKRWCLRQGGRMRVLRTAAAAAVVVVVVVVVV